MSNPQSEIQPVTQVPQPNVQRVIEDPRSRSDFQPGYYPKANGQEAPPVDPSGRNERFVLEFLAVYYFLNREYSRLLEVRERGDSPERGGAERACLQAVEKLLTIRDSLEDRYAPLGIIAEPVVKAGFTVDVNFSFGNVDGSGRLRSDSYRIATYVPLPLPPGVKLEELQVKITGPGINTG